MRDCGCETDFPDRRIRHSRGMFAIIVVLARRRVAEAREKKYKKRDERRAGPEEEKEEKDKNAVDGQADDRPPDDG